MNFRVFVLIALFIEVPLHAQTSGWDALRTLQNRYELQFYKVDGSCRYAQIVKFTTSSVTIRWSQNAQETLIPGQILMVGAGHDVVYSGRSSWYDVREAKPGHAERLEIQTKAGRRYAGSLVSSSDDQIVLRHAGQQTTLTKAEIATADYISQKPPTDGQAYMSQEAPYLELFDPDVWMRGLGLSSKLRIRLYDSSKPQDDRPLSDCRNETSTPKSA